MSAAPGDAAASNLRAIASMIASQLAFILNDALIKLAAAELPAGQAIFIRGLFALALALVIATAVGALRPSALLADGRAITLRNIGEIGSTFFYLLALFQMPIADTTAILQFVPLAIMAAAALFLGEPVGWRRWSAACVGLVGVLIVIRPGTAGFSIWSLLAVASVFFSVLRDLATRRITTAVPTMLLVVVSAAVVTLSALAFYPFETWVAPGRRPLLLLAAAALFLLGGYFFITDAMRHGEVAVVSPFRYSVMIWAVIAGLAIFGERPDGTAMLGSAIVVAAGIYSFVRERKLGRARPGVESST